MWTEAKDDAGNTVIKTLCDTDTCDGYISSLIAWQIGDEYLEAIRAQIRERARESGWQLGSEKDICPSCQASAMVVA